ncbi:MAG: hypothetical protein KDC53_08360 [Saprospiraceae bacterium]|nr:hypothetical protein [Saprospiraceae bacterium]
MKNRLVLSQIFMLLLLLTACGGDKKSDSSAAQSMESDKPKKYKVTPFSKSESFPDAKLSNMTYKDGKFSFDVTGNTYKLGEQTADASQKMCANSDKGQHIHLIVDFKPYVAQYVSSFDQAVDDGQHNILAFLSRSYHESIKTEDAHIAKRVRVQSGNIVESNDITEPAIFYSRPKGTYVGDDTKKIMLDFYVLNADIGDDYLVKVQINGEVTLLDKWQPYYIEGLPMGQSTIGLALVYKDGSPVPGAQTSTLQQITLMENDPPAN